MTDSIIQKMTGYCYLCGMRATETHHCVHGRMRKKADEYGLTVTLCRECHRKLHDQGIHDRELQELAERVFLKVIGRRLAHDLWMREFGKDYLTEEGCEDE